MSQVLEKYWTSVMYVLAVAIIFIFIYLVVKRQKSKKNKTITPKITSEFDMRKEFQTLMQQQTSLKR